MRTAMYVVYPSVYSRWSSVSASRSSRLLAEIKKRDGGGGGASLYPQPSLMMLLRLRS
eukprot:CAMPEP_0185307722 /NCGR_PEP_ID=MMETSP1363-20130426/16949_1 /TAXON_ID=38817 /ORGANISM="Gephyrocapsa oceanica, Strain RCC1303" /LENGTH=57 /DNA_ID=CAMNT_0027905067 /DNA_START=23 /DNA_END=193 /DNA_ORIENTATION=-